MMQNETVYRTQDKKERWLTIWNRGIYGAVCGIYGDNCLLLQQLQQSIRN